ncbi:MAG: lysylphosphatidylglycerol synthase transmembrane domain-containing protein [Candidatus Woesearchaeota archaeon]|jgi:hypothetical protein|nr:lysylphosphatidylglycerol synthase transmembrane domain-containing protein [Candidatus Woesearchaeota archaeon]
MKISMKYFSIIGILIFIFVLSRIDITQSLILILNSSLLFLGIAFLVAVVEVIIRATKWKILINVFNKSYKLTNALQTYLIGFAFGAITPSKAGDFVKIMDLRNKTNIEMKKCFSISIFDRIIDFLNLILTAMISISLAIIIFPQLNHILFPLWLVVITLFIIALFSITKYTRLLIKPFYFLIPKKFQEKAREVYHAFQEIISLVGKHKSFLIYLLVDFIAWVITYTTPFFIALALGLKIPIIHFLLLMPIIGIIELIPISILGVGSRDITLLALFTPFGLIKEEIIGISMLLLFISMIPRALAGFLISWIKDKKKPNLSS